MRVRSEDDKFTIVAIALVACMLQDVLHEGLGHGVVAWLSGAHRLTISTVALQSDIDTRWISAAGTLVNLLFGGIFWLILRRAQRFQPGTVYFLVIAMAGNLFIGTGYFLFSGVADFGDWAAVIHGLQPYWLWRVGLIVLGVVFYRFSLKLVAAELKHFSTETSPARIRWLSWIPYVADGVLAAAAGVLNPAGIFYVIASALPSTLGANVGLLWLPFFVWRRGAKTNTQIGPIQRSIWWIAAAAVLAVLFIGVLGRGITWTK